MITEHTSANEMELKARHRSFIDASVPVSLLAYDPVRELYVFDVYPSGCTCPEFNPDDYDGPEDHAAACSSCPDHGNGVI